MNIDASIDLPSTDSYLKIRELLERALAETLTKVVAANGMEGLLLQALTEREHSRPEPDSTSPAHLPLTEREYEVLRQVATGASNKEIARALNLSLHTVKRHVANILNKLGVDSRVEAATLLYSRH